MSELVRESYYLKEVKSFFRHDGASFERPCQIQVFPWRSRVFSIERVARELCRLRIGHFEAEHFLMQIETLKLHNFRGFKDFEIRFHPQFTLLIGENGSGKSSVLDAVSVALGIWGSKGQKQVVRSIRKAEVRLEPKRQGDRILFEHCFPVLVQASGQIDSSAVSWVRTKQSPSSNTQTINSREAIQAIDRLFDQEASRPLILPFFGYYGAHRSWTAAPTKFRWMLRRFNTRWDAYRDSLSGRNSLANLNSWFLMESAARDNRGIPRPGFESVRFALRKCIPGAKDVWFDHDVLEPVVEFSTGACLFSNLSDGQKSMAGLAADIALRIVTLNSFLIDQFGLELNDPHPPPIFLNTPGVVLIDELDAHLHPKWQRHVVHDLTATFPQIQFICATHSPQVIGELKSNQVLEIGSEHGYPIRSSFGLDSSRVLEEVMNAPSRNDQVTDLINEISNLIDRDDLSNAKERIQHLATLVGENDAEVIRARTMIKVLEE